MRSEIKMNQNVDSAVLGAWTFFASAHPIDVCGINGLPLTPNSIRILGKFQSLKLVIHPHLCTYLDVLRGKHERVMIVSEHYLDSLENRKRKTSMKNVQVLAKATFEILTALSYLHLKGIVHRCIAPHVIRFNNQDQVKLSKYGLYYMTECGSTVSFPIGASKYIAPEVLAHGLTGYASSPKSDIWSMGMVLLELILEVTLWDGATLETIFKDIISFLKFKKSEEIINHVARRHNVLENYEKSPLKVKQLVEECLNPIPSNRTEAHQLLTHPLFSNCVSKLEPMQLSPLFLSTQLRCNGIKDIHENIPLIDHLSKRPLQEVYYLWRLAGGDVETELRRQELIKAKPPILTVSKIISGEGEEFGHERDQAYLLDDVILELPLEPLRQRLHEVDCDVYYPLIEYMLNGTPQSLFFNTLKETSKLPLIIKEKDVEYQLHRTVYFKRLLEAYPYKKSQIVQEAKQDIPPIYRPYVWATLLDVEGNINAVYDNIDKETPTPTDRQIEVDIPRCHQYDDLLSSPAGHHKFKRILKAWVISHPQYVYWQGLDSLCAPFLSLNFNDEAVAYACLSSFIPRYLHNFFLKDNSAVIQEYLAKFSHLIAFHDPELTNHLENIGFIPELYAIPWFLTMYTHVFPLHKIFHLWDTLLLGHSSFPLYIGVAILKQLRNNLLSYGFNECILMFSDMPEIDIQRCVQDSIRLFCGTPKSITYRAHESPDYKHVLYKINSSFTNTDIGNPDLKMQPISIEELKSEISPRISAEDLLDLLDLLPDSRNKLKSHSDKILVIDIRPNEDYIRTALEKSINIPFSTAFAPDGSLDSSVPFCSKGKIITIIDGCKDNLSSKFASRMVKLGYSHVCTLHGGIEILRKTSFLVAKIGET